MALGADRLQGLPEHHGRYLTEPGPLREWPWPQSAAPIGAPLPVQRQHIEHHNRPA